jgi:integrase
VEIGERSGKVIILHGKGNKRAEVPLMSSIGRKWVSAWITSAGLTGTVPRFNVTPRTAQRAVTEIGQDAGLARLSAHDLRWTFIKRTRLGKNAKDNQVVPLEIVKKLSRHSRLETLLHYIEPSWDEMEAAVGGM